MRKILSRKGEKHENSKGHGKTKRTQTKGPKSVVVPSQRVDQPHTQSRPGPTQAVQGTSGRFLSIKSALHMVINLLI